MWSKICGSAKVLRVQNLKLGLRLIDENCPPDSLPDSIQVIQIPLTGPLESC